MKMVEIKRNGHTIYKHVPDDWKPEDEEMPEIRGDLTTGGRKSIGFADIKQEKWDRIFKKGGKDVHTN